MFGRKKVDYLEGTYYEGDNGGPYGLDLFKRQTKRIFRTIVDFDKDYLGQRRVELWPLHFEDKSLLCRMLRHLRLGLPGLRTIQAKSET